MMNKQEVKRVYEQIVAGLKDIDVSEVKAVTTI